MCSGHAAGLAALYGSQCSLAVSQLFLTIRAALLSLYHALDILELACALSPKLFLSSQ